MVTCLRCRRCQTPRPGGGGGGGCGGGGGGGGGRGQNPMPGDWYCPGCKARPLATLATLANWSAAGPLLTSSLAGWVPCTSAKPAHQPARQPCSQAARQPRQLSWAAPAQLGSRGASQAARQPAGSACEDLQFARNSTCRMCQTPKPADAEGATHPRPCLPLLFHSPLGAGTSPRRAIETTPTHC